MQPGSMLTVVLRVEESDERAQRLLVRLRGRNQDVSTSIFTRRIVWMLAHQGFLDVRVNVDTSEPFVPEIGAAVQVDRCDHFHVGCSDVQVIR